MSAKIYKIKLTEDERKELVAKRDGKFTKATILKRCIALLMADEGYFGPSHIDAEIRTATGLSLRTIERLRLRCCEVGPVAALLAQPREQSPLKVKSQARSKRVSRNSHAVSHLPDMSAGPCASWRHILSKSK